MVIIIKIPLARYTHDFFTWVSYRSCPNSSNSCMNCSWTNPCGVRPVPISRTVRHVSTANRPSSAPRPVAPASAWRHAVGVARERYAAAGRGSRVLPMRRLPAATPAPSRRESAHPPAPTGTHTPENYSRNVCVRRRPRVSLYYSCCPPSPPAGRHLLGVICRPFAYCDKKTEDEKFKPDRQTLWSQVPAVLVASARRFGRKCRRFWSQVRAYTTDNAKFTWREQYYYYILCKVSSRE